MKHLIPILLLLTSTLSAQPQADPLRTVEDINPITNAFTKKANEYWDAGDNITATQYSLDSTTFALLGQQLTASYLVDSKGEVWSLGVMDQPFVIQTLYVDCGGCEEYLVPINTIAKEFSDELIIFLLLPKPTSPEGLALIDRFDDNVVVIFDDDYRDPKSWPTDNKLLGMIGYPITYYVSSELKIMSLIRGSTPAYIHHRTKHKTISKKHERDPIKRLRKGIERLLR